MTDGEPAAALPAPNAGVRYLVSLPVALVARRPGLLVVGDLIRGGDGPVTACRSLGTFGTCQRIEGQGPSEARAGESMVGKGIWTPQLAFPAHGDRVSAFPTGFTKPITSYTFGPITRQSSFSSSWGSSGSVHRSGF